MGFSALDVLRMGTRCGQVDPGVPLNPMDREGMSAAEISDMLHRRSGLLGLSGVSNDMRLLEASDDPRAAEAISGFVVRIQREIGGLAAAPDWLDGIVFCGGIGENVRDPGAGGRWHGLAGHRVGPRAERGQRPRDLARGGRGDGDGPADRRGTGDRPGNPVAGDRGREECRMKRALRTDGAAALVPDRAVLLIGGFMGVGSPHRRIEALVARGLRGLTIVAHDTATPGLGIGKLISWAVPRVVASHIGRNPETRAGMISGEIAVEPVPQGTLVERIRAGGVSLGGVLTATGIGTEVEDGKQGIELDGGAIRSNARSAAILP
jgi:hypothetical protein